MGLHEAIYTLDRKHTQSSSLTGSLLMPMSVTSPHQQVLQCTLIWTLAITLHSKLRRLASL
jgi:hypothetical protein